jgi:hypothetical protein
MKTIHFRVGCTFASGLVLALLAATAQEAPTVPKQGDVGRVTVERDKEKEDQVAKLFESIRAQARLPQLKRIRHRDDLEQGVCTSALTGEASKRWSSLYTTADPGSITTELEKIASSNRLGPNKRPWYARYSVAVWRMKDPNAEVAYRVGVGLYETALGEFVDCHFTDDVYYCGNWKASIARPCRGK